MGLRLLPAITAAFLAYATLGGPAARANPVMRPLTTECVVNAAALYHLPEPLVWTILYVEGGKVGTVSGNKNGTADLGPMQINTRSEEHTSELQSLMRISYAVFCLKKKTPSTYK